MSERDKATSIAKLMSAAGRKKTRQPIKVVKAAGPNRGIAGRPKGGSFLFSLLLTRSLLTMFFYSQGAVQDGRPTYEEGNAGTEKGVEKEEVDTYETAERSRTGCPKIFSDFSPSPEDQCEMTNLETLLVLTHYILSILTLLTDLTKLVRG